MADNQQQIMRIAKGDDGRYEADTYDAPALNHEAIQGAIDSIYPGPVGEPIGFNRSSIPPIFGERKE